MTAHGGPGSMKVNEVLVGAIYLLNERGWTQKKLEDADGRLCLMGAINLAVTGYPNPYHPNLPKGPELVTLRRVAERLLQHIPQPFHITEFNDMTGQTKAGIIKLLRDAAKEKSA